MRDKSPYDEIVPGRNITDMVTASSLVMEGPGKYIEGGDESDAGKGRPAEGTGRGGSRRSQGPSFTPRPRERGDLTLPYIQLRVDGLAMADHSSTFSTRKKRPRDVNGSVNAGGKKEPVDSMGRGEPTWRWA